MRPEQFIIKNLSRLSRLEQVSLQEVCRCSDGGGRLLYDYKKRDFIFEGRCKAILLCTIIKMWKFKNKLRENGYIRDTIDGLDI